jgi:hypothetical protein
MRPPFTNLLGDGLSIAFLFRHALTDPLRCCKVVGQRWGTGAIDHRHGNLFPFTD